MCLRILKRPVIGYQFFVMQFEMHYGNTITTKLWTPSCLTVSTDYEWICISFCIAQNHMGESYKIISSQTERSFYQILYSH